MGWVEQGKMPIKFKILRPFTVAKARFFDKEKYTGQSEDPSPFQKWTLGVLGSLDRYVQRTNQLATLFSPQYISWRYANNPLYSYNYFTDQENYLLISRIKMHAYTKELRLVDFIRLNPQADNGYLNATMKAQVSTFCDQHQIDFISLFRSAVSGQQSLLQLDGYVAVRAPRTYDHAA